MKKIISSLALATALLLCGGLTARAQQYTYTTLLAQGTTNGIADGAATNVHIVSTMTNGIGLTKYGDFVLDVDGYVAGALTNGFIDVQWATSMDGSAWSTNAGYLASELGAKSGPKGWFSIPVGSGGSRIHWRTNITVDAIGYWRINYMTNRTGSTVSNTTIRAYTKPKRNG